MLVGRAAESGWLKRRVARARHGKGGAVLVTGEPGMGKTALARQLCGSTRRMTVLRGTGVESEASLGFSVLADICRPLLGLLNRSPGRRQPRCRPRSRSALPCSWTGSRPMPAH